MSKLVRGLHYFIKLRVFALTVSRAGITLGFLSPPSTHPYHFRYSTTCRNSFKELNTSTHLTSLSPKQVFGTTIQQSACGLTRAVSTLHLRSSCTYLRSYCTSPKPYSTRQHSEARVNCDVLGHIADPTTQQRYKAHAEAIFKQRPHNKQL